MRKTFFIIAGLILSLPLSGWAQSDATLVHGLLEEDITWYAKNSPYVVTDDVIVDNGVTLTIEAGVEVRLAHTTGGQETPFSTADTDIIVKGTLIAVGTPETPIRFVLTGIGDNWGAIYFATGSSPDCILQQCDITKGRIICNYASPTITNCHISEGGGIEIAYLAGPHITKNRIEKNTRGITSWFYSSKLDVTYNIITDNDYGLYIKDFSQANVTSDLIYANAKYDVYNLAPRDIPMPGNWWGTLIVDFIHDHIYDNVANKKSGKIFFEPIAKTEAMALATVTPTITPTPTPARGVQSPQALPSPTPTPKLKRRRRAQATLSQPTPTPTPVPQSGDNDRFRSNW